MDYSPEMIDRWLRSWQLLEALAETPRTARHHLTPHHRQSDAACQPMPSVGTSGKGHRYDQHRYSDIMADIRRAHAQLRAGSLGWRAVDYRMRFGGSLGMIRVALGVGSESLHTSYDEALKEMARHLGWTDAGC